MATRIIDGIETKIYSDNDGGLWCFHPVTGAIIKVEDIDYDGERVNRCGDLLRCG